MGLGDNIGNEAAALPRDLADGDTGGPALPWDNVRLGAEPPSTRAAGTSGLRPMLHDGPAALDTLSVIVLPCLFGLLVAASAFSAEYPAPVEGDFVLKDFKFRSGETLPELRLHYTTVGTLRRDAQGHATNAVLSMHGTGGSGSFMLNPDFAGGLFGPGQPLDATKYYIILPDAIGHGKSSKPSDGLRANFPRYGYRDMLLKLNKVSDGGAAEWTALLKAHFAGC